MLSEEDRIFFKTKILNAGIPNSILPTALALIEQRKDNTQSLLFQLTGRDFLKEDGIINNPSPAVILASKADTSQNGYGSVSEAFAAQNRTLQGLENFASTATAATTLISQALLKNTVTIKGTQIVDYTTPSSKLIPYTAVEVPTVQTLKFYSTEGCTGTLLATIVGSRDPIEMFYAHLQCIQVVPYGIRYKVGDGTTCNRLTGDLIHELAYDCEKNLFTVPIIGQGSLAPIADWGL